MADGSCVVCGELLTGRQQRYCSRPCSIKGETNLRRDSGRLKVRNQRDKAKRNAWRRANGKRLREPYRYTEMVRCHVCRKPFWRDAYPSERNRAKHCSGPCYQVLVAGRERRAAARRKLRAAARGTRSRCLFIVGPCSWCGKVCTVRTNHLTAGNYCSSACIKARGRDVRRARKAGAEREHFRRQEVFRRDGWTCRLCLSPINPHAEVPDPWAPTVDHVVPLANGGSHALDNLQPAHFICNSIKGNRDIVGVSWSGSHAQRTWTTTEGPIAAGPYELRPDPACDAGLEEGAAAVVGEAT